MSQGGQDPFVSVFIYQRSAKLREAVLASTRYCLFQAIYRNGRCDCIFCPSPLILCLPVHARLAESPPPPRRNKPLSGMPLPISLPLEEEVGGRHRPCADCGRFRLVVRRTACTAATGPRLAPPPPPPLPPCRAAAVLLLVAVVSRSRCFSILLYRVLFDASRPAENIHI